LDLVEPEIIGNVWELKEFLKFDITEARGVFIILIHSSGRRNLREVLWRNRKDFKTKRKIMNRKNVVAFVDEGTGLNMAFLLLK